MFHSIKKSEIAFCQAGITYFISQCCVYNMLLVSGKITNQSHYRALLSRSGAPFTGTIQSDHCQSSVQSQSEHARTPVQSFWWHVAHLSPARLTSDCHYHRRRRRCRRCRRRRRRRRQSGLMIGWPRRAWGERATPQSGVVRQVFPLMSGRWRLDCCLREYWIITQFEDSTFVRVASVLSGLGITYETAQV